MAEFTLDQPYISFLQQLKEKIKSAQLRAAAAVNQEVIGLYWYLGRQILERQEKAKWGEHFLQKLSHDLQTDFPETHGFSVPSLKRMRLFAQLYPTLELSSQAVSQLPWGHISVLIHKIKDAAIRDWYAEQDLKEGWSRHSLETAIKRGLYQQQALEVNKTSNFLARLPSPQSRLAHELLKNPYNFDFLGLHDDALERDIEHASIEHITKFLLELGRGFAFVGRQIPITLQEEEYFIDMLFYHLKLHCYVVIELKATKFKPEHSGQLNFYLNLVDDYYKTPQDNPSIGLLLCKSRNQFVAEYALKGIEKPIGVSEYELTKAIPDTLKDTLPSVLEIEAELNQLEQATNHE
jgi:predicted nuclease of restriction endonuclease-like (RecB) superfamily